MEISPHPPTVLRARSSSERGSLATSVIPFNREIMEAPCPKKVKMSFVEPFDETTNLDYHLDVYKA